MCHSQALVQEIHSKKNKQCLTIQGNPIERVTETKLLCFTFDEKMSLSSHTDKISPHLKCVEQYLLLKGDACLKAD